MFIYPLGIFYKITNGRLNMNENLVAALFLSMAIMAITDYLKKPITSNLKIVEWLLKHNLAMTDGTDVTLWWLPYLTFVIGLALSLVFGINLVSDILPNSPILAAQILTAVIVGCGSNVINDLVGSVRIGRYACHTASGYSTWCKPGEGIETETIYKVGKY